MIITLIGHSCFKLQDKIGSDGLTLVTDPYDKTLGLKVPNFEANIATVSHNNYAHNNVESLRGNPFIINCPGEYDVKGILVQGIHSYHDDKNGKEAGENIIFRIEMDDITIVHLGSLGHILNDAQLAELKSVDILIIPVGGSTTLDAKKAVTVISQIEPRIVIPMQYNAPGLKLEHTLDELDKFIKEIGINPTKDDKLKISKKDLPQDGMELVVLNNQK